MKVGCFALVDPFSTLEHQLERVSEMGFKYADITDNHSGGLLGKEFDFTATVSLDENPMDVKRKFNKYGINISAVCAHANLLDPSSPGRYGNTEIMKAIKFANIIGVSHVITTEGEPHTDWHENYTFEEKIAIISDKLIEPVKLARDLGVTILLEPHGPITGTIDGMYAIMEKLGDPNNLGVCLDTGNSWLAGSDPVEFAKEFKNKIGHVHWKDMPQEWEEKRGEMYGCGMSIIPLGTGLVDIKGIFNVLKDAPNLEYTTLEIAGDENIISSYKYLKSLGAK